MEDKYYIPDISEFHDGFKYEYNHPIDGWVKFTFGEFEDSDILEKEEELEDSMCRVKYLDKADIESCEIPETTKMFNHSYAGKAKRFQNDRNGVRIVFVKKGTHNNSYILIERKNNIRAGGPWEIRFQGTVNNLSELKKLLKQLNIINDTLQTKL